MKTLLFLLFIALIPAAAWSKDLEIYGYFEPQYFAFTLNDDFYQMQSNKLRFDLTRSLSAKVRLNANFDFINYNGKTSYNIMDFLPAGIISEIPPEEVPNYELTYKDTMFLDNAYVRLYPSWGSITIGRQQIALGTGYAWNPTDIFNIKDILDPTYEKPGVNALTLNIPLSRRFYCTGIYSPGEKFQRSTGYARLKGNIAHYGFSLSAAFTKWETTDYYTFNPIFQDRYMTGFDFAGEIIGLGFWLETAHNFMEKTEDFSEFLIGADYTLNDGTYLMSEFYHNGLAQCDRQNYDLNDWMDYFSGSSRSLGKDNLFLYLERLIADLTNIGASVIYCISDESIILIPQIVHRPYQNIEITAMGNIYSGYSNASFNPNIGNAALIRFRAYF